MLHAKDINNSLLTYSATSHLIFKDETTTAKVHKHLSDFNDEITDEDILNIKTVMVSSSKPESQKRVHKLWFR